MTDFVRMKLCAGEEAILGSAGNANEPPPAVRAIDTSSLADLSIRPKIVLIQ